MSISAGEMRNMPAAWWLGAPFTPAPVASAPASVPEAPEHHAYGLVYDFADIKRRVPKAHWDYDI